MSSILSPHLNLSKAAAEQAAANHIVAGQHEHQALTALSRFGNAPLVLPPECSANASPASADCVTPPDQLQQLEAYVQYRIALAMRGEV